MPNGSCNWGRRGGQPLQSFALHPAAPRAVHPPHFELQVDSQGAAGEIASQSGSPIVKGATQTPTLATLRFFRRRRKGRTRALGSPNTPCTWLSGTKPGNRYASRNCRLNFRMRSLKQVFESPKSQKMPVNKGSNLCSAPKITHSSWRRASFVSGLNSPSETVCRAASALVAQTMLMETFASGSPAN